MACLFLAVAAARGRGQATYYYSQEKTVDPATKQTSRGQGHRAGLFITFNAKGCYDSDRKGYDVGNGFREETSRNDRFITYVGSSYWGDARYVVALDKSRINIHAPDRILVYVRSQVPSGTVTSALIRGSGSPSGRPAPAMPPSVIYPVDPSAGSSTGSSADKAAMYLAHYQRLEQNVKEAFHAYERTMAGSYDSSRSGMARAIYDIQRNMRSWRSDALRDGVTISPSPWETAQPSIGTIHTERKYGY